ncbi:Uncharacterised protein [uncultured archaeon]|nr:Uncharacterised protein [uncultured archaeon]
MDDKIKNVTNKPAMLRAKSGEEVNLTPGGVDKPGVKRPKKPIPLVENPIRKKK